MCHGTALNVYLVILVAAAVGVSDFPWSVRVVQADWENTECLVAVV